MYRRYSAERMKKVATGVAVLIALCMVAACQTSKSASTVPQTTPMPTDIPTPVATHPPTLISGALTAPTEVQTTPTPTDSATPVATHPPKPTPAVLPAPKDIAAPAPLLRVPDVACRKGQEVQLPIWLSTQGATSLAGYELTVGIKEVSSATFVSVQFPPGYGRTSELPNTTIRLAFLNTSGAIQPTERESLLATLRAPNKMNSTA